MALRYSDLELEELLADDESELVERKAGMTGEAPNAIREAICAFANDIHNHRRPGLIFIGIDDQGRPSDLPITDELLRQLADMKSDGNTVPPPSMSVEKRRISGADVAVVAVQPSDAPPVRCRGRIWIRVGPRRMLASAQDERILAEKRKSLDLYFDVQPVRSSTLDDLDLARFTLDFLPKAFAPDILAANDRTVIQQLAATKMIASVDDPTPTVTGLLALAERPRDYIPGALIQFLRLDGENLGSDIIDAARYEGPIRDQIERLDQKLDAHIRTRVDITSGPLERRTFNYPLTTLQQLTRNAVMHRTYQGPEHLPSASHVSVFWFNDRVEIHSPGGPFGDVTAANFGEPGAVGHRNPNLADVMKVLGLVQRFGIGIAMARQALGAEHAERLAFDVKHGWITCTIRGNASS